MFWPSFDHRGEHKLCGAYIPINLKSKNVKQEMCITIRVVPNALQCLPHEWTEADFLQKVCNAFVDGTGLKLAYQGDSMASVAHRAIQELEVTQRVHVSLEHKAFFMKRQEGRRGACGDTFKDTDQVELHHRVALAQGHQRQQQLGTSSCSVPSAETQMQELPGVLTPFHTLKSQMNPVALHYVTELQKPTQLRFAGGPVPETA